MDTETLVMEGAKRHLMCNKIILSMAVNFDDETVNKEDTGSDNDKKRAEVGLNSDIAHEDE